MIDFKKLTSTLNSIDSINPVDIFDQLPKPSNIDDLHKSQAETLQLWYEHRDKKDTVIKLNTGGGKTLVGLLIGISSARELKRGALYLVDNRQLAQQVCMQAEALNIPASVYSGKTSLTANFRNGNEILIATYQALFNGKTAFGLDASVEPEEVAAIIVDDAHSSFDKLRDVFSTTLLAEDDRALFQNIVALFRNDFVTLDRETSFDELVNGTGSIGGDVLEVPFWSWLDNRRSVASLITDKVASLSGGEIDDTSKSLFFNWPLIKDDLKYCQAFIGRNRLTITPLLPLVDKFPTFRNAPRRVFMSATFADESALIRSFGCSRKQLNVIAPKTLAGVGRRMILQLNQISKYQEALVKEMRSLSNSGVGVVILEPSFSSAEKWADYGVNIANPNDVESEITSLREGTASRPIAFANRYNGIDLPGNACRLLIISGIPSGMSDYQKIYSNKMSKSRVYARTLAQNLEQAIGRGTRGSGDHCVVILLGNDLCEWVNDERHIKYMTHSTRAQIQCGVPVMNEIHSPEDFIEVIEAGVRGDSDISEYLTQAVAQTSSVPADDSDDELLSFASAERKAFTAWRAGDEGGCITYLLNFSSQNDTDNSLKGLALQMAAQAEYSEGNTASSRQMQERAHSFNPAIMKAAFYPKARDSSSQSQAILRIVEEYENSARDLVSEFDKKTQALISENESAAFEMGLESLGHYLGADSQRFDHHGIGPDVLWYFTDSETGVIIEAKSSKNPSNPFTKKEHGQLLVAKEWFKSEYTNKQCFAVSVHPNDFADENASAEDTLVITLEEVRGLTRTVRSLLVSLISTPRNRESRLAACDFLLDAYCLHNEQSILSRTTHFKSRQSRANPC